MKNVLLISYYFSENEIIGSLRSQGLARYLHEFGWHPMIITKETKKPLRGNNFELFEVPNISRGAIWKKRFGWEENKSIKSQKGFPVLKKENTFFDNALTVVNDLLYFPDEAASWINAASEKAYELVESRKIDAIISTSSPVSSHFIARNIKRRYGLPWLADYRDLWSQNHYRSSKIKGIMNIVSEKIVNSDADMLSTVSGPLVDKLSNFHSGKSTVAILNGYSPDIINPGTPLDDKVRLIHTGSLYQGRRDPEPLFRSLYELLTEGKINKDAFLIDFYGSAEDWLFDDIGKYGLGDIVKIRGPITRDEALLEQRKAQVLLLLTWDNPEEYGVYTGKLFEYIAAKRPILLLGSTNGVASKLINKLNIGKSASTIEDIKTILNNYYKEYSEFGAIRYLGLSNEIQSLSHKRMAQEFSDALNKISGS